jgi:N utilization substance protein B
MNRSMVRTIVVQCLYQIGLTGARASEALQAIRDDAAGDNEVRIADKDVDALLGVAAHWIEAYVPHHAQLEQLLSTHLQHWQIDRLSRIDRHVLLFALYEMLHTDVPDKVAMSEAVMIAQQFGTAQNGKFVNGVLGHMYDTLKME